MQSEIECYNGKPLRSKAQVLKGTCGDEPWNPDDLKITYRGRNFSNAWERSGKNCITINRNGNMSQIGSRPSLKISFTAAKKITPGNRDYLMGVVRQPQPKQNRGESFGIFLSEYYLEDSLIPGT